MGFSRIFEHTNQKGGIVVDLGQPDIFHLLYSLGPAVRRKWLGRHSIPDRRLELDCDDGPCRALVLDEFKMGRSKFGMVEPRF